MHSSAMRLVVIPVLVVAGTQVLRSALDPWLGPQVSPIQMFSFLAVFIAAWTGGLSAGVIATPLAILATYVEAMLLGRPSPSFGEGDAARIVLFSLISVIFSVLSEAHLRAQRRLAQQRDALAEERTRQRLFAFLAENAPDFIGVCDMEFRPVFVNRAGLALVGLSSVDDLKSIRVSDFFFPEDVERLQNEFFPRVTRDGYASTEVRFRHMRTGEPIWMEYGVIRMEDADGRPSGFATISRDLTERRRAEDLLREAVREKDLSLTRFRELADSMPQIVWSADATGKTDYTNQRWRDLVGERAGETGAGTFVHPEDRPRVLDLWRRAQETGEAWEAEFRLMLPEPHGTRWFLGRTVPVRNAEGRLVRWYGTSTDIHARKMAEAELAEKRERLRAALDASMTGTFRWNLDTHELDWDANLDRLFGLAPGTSVRSLEEFIRMVHPDDRLRVMDACRRSAEHGSDFEEEFRVGWPDGTVRWIYDKGRVYSDGTRRYITGGCTDITERRRKEDALREAARQKDEFLGMLAHELRNPLAPMMYSIAMLDQRVQDPLLRRPLDVIGRQVRRMTRMVDDLLDVARVTQGKVSLKRETLDLARIVTEAVEASRSVIESRRHTLALDVRDTRLPVSGDAVRLSQVVENVLHNAAKYTPEGGRITVGVRRDDREAVISVADTGIGIAPAMLSRVFDLFVQADTSLDRAEGGLGIGLTVVHRLVRMHGGRVEARSEGLGLGTEFVIRLPLVNAELTAGGVRRATGSAPRRRILIVDDNHDSAQSLGTLLEMDGHEVRLEGLGLNAATAAREFSPDLVLLDIGLPGMDGFEVVRQFRASPDLASLPVIAVTGYAREEDRQRCFDAGFDDHLTKPVDVSRLTAILSAA